MITFFRKNWKQLLIISGIILLSSLITAQWKSNMEWVSIMLSVPAFIMSFIVLDRFNLNSDLNKAIETELENRKIEKSEVEQFIKTVENELSDVRNSIKNIEKYYNIQNGSNRNSNMLPNTIENAQDSLAKFKKFQQETVYFVRGRVSIKEKISQKTSQTNPFPLNCDEINSMEDKLNKIDNNYFKSLKEIGDEFSSYIDKEKIRDLKEFFIDTNSFASRYFKLVTQIQASLTESED